MDSRLKGSYATRFNLQSLLAIQDLPGDTTHAHQLIQQWKAALAMLRGVDDLKQLDLDQVRFYSTCSDNSIFNDIPSAILSEAVGSYLGSHFTTWLVQCRGNLHPTDHYQVHPPAFWVALSACVLGNLNLFETYISKLTLSVETSSTLSPPDLLIAKQPIVLLTVAIRHAKLCIVSRLFELHPNLMSEIQTDYAPLQAAIFSNDNEILKALLEYTHNFPDLLTDALSRYKTLLTRSSSGTEIIRLLTRHFTPLSAESRTWLIIHSCAVGDVMLLGDFSKTEPLFSHRIYDADGRIPTYVNFAIRCGNVDSLRFLLDHGVLENQDRQPLRMATEQALSFNQIECYRELYPRFDASRHGRLFDFLALAENAEEFMAKFIHEYGSIILEPLRSSDDPPLSIAQKALWTAIQRLRPGNIRFLLGAGVRILPWHSSWLQPEDPFEIRWPYFNQNRDAFLRTQAVLNAFELPKLRITV